jgi:Na+/H+ antiporter NhaD/arsenite permease-like protein
MSNVPATIFISQFSDNYQAIAYGVNLAGSGLIISSLANIIAVRFLNNSKGYIIYHKYGIPYFIISYIFVYLLLIK